MTVVGALVVLSAILMASVLFGSVSSTQVLVILAVAATVGVGAATFFAVRGWRRRLTGRPLAEAAAAPVLDRKAKENWRMPQLAMLAPVQMSAARRVAMLAMWAYLGIAFVLVIVRVIELAAGH